MGLNITKKDLEIIAKCGKSFENINFSKISKVKISYK